MSAYFLIPAGLIWRGNNLTAHIREVISIAAKAPEENFRSKGKNILNLASHLAGVFSIRKAELKWLNTTKLFISVWPK